MNYIQLKENLLKHVHFTQTELEKISEYFEPVFIKKGDFLLEHGSIYNFEGFVINGCFRIFTIDKKGNEITLYFAIKDWWLMDHDSYLSYK